MQSRALTYDRQQPQPRPHWPADGGPINFDGQSIELGLVAEQTEPRSRSSIIDGFVIGREVKWLTGAWLPQCLRTNIDLIRLVSR